MSDLQPIEIQEELIDAYALLTYVSEQTTSEIGQEWNQGLQMAIEMTKTVLMLHSSSSSMTTRNERRLLTKQAKKRTKQR